MSDLQRTFPLMIAVMMAMTSMGCVESSDDSGGGKLPTWKVGQGWLYSMTDYYSFEDSDGYTYEHLTETSLEVRVSGINVINGTGCYQIEEISRKNGIARAWDWYALQRSSLNKMSGWDPEGPYDFPLKSGKSWTWTFDTGDYVINMESNCTRKRSIKTVAGSFDCYLISYKGSHSESDGDEESKTVIRGTLFYSPKVEKAVLSEESRHYEYRYGTYRSERIYSETRNLITYGSQDSDGDSVCNKVEEWAGMDPKDIDSDSDGVADNEDCAPLIDLGIRLDLTHFTSSEDTDTSEGMSGYECDPYLELNSWDVDLEETLGPYSDQNDVELGFTRTFDLGEYVTYVDFEVDVFDDDSGELADLDGDDTIDINPSDYGEGVYIDIDLLENCWSCYPGAEGNGGEESSVSGSDDGDGTYDGTLWFCFTIMDMGSQG